MDTSLSKTETFPPNLNAIAPAAKEGLHKSPERVLGADVIA